MASHRGYDSGQHGGTWREQVITEIPGASSTVQLTPLQPQRDVVAIGAAWRPSLQSSESDNTSRKGSSMEKSVHMLQSSDVSSVNPVVQGNSMEKSAHMLSLTQKVALCLRQ